MFGASTATQPIGKKMNEQDRDTQIAALMLESAGFCDEEIGEKLQLERNAVRQLLGLRPILTLRHGETK